MEDVIKVLEEEHQTIQEAMSELLKITKGCPVKTDDLLGLERLILNHISREDAEIYKPLKKLVKLTPEAAKFLDFSRQNLEDLKILALIFFEKFRDEKSEVLCEGFHKDLSRLAEKLGDRIEMEDHHLFPFLRDLWRRL